MVHFFLYKWNVRILDKTCFFSFFLTLAFCSRYWKKTEEAARTASKKNISGSLVYLFILIGIPKAYLVWILTSETWPLTTNALSLNIVYSTWRGVLLILSSSDIYFGIPPFSWNYPSPFPLSSDRLQHWTPHTWTNFRESYARHL